MNVLKAAFCAPLLIAVLLLASCNLFEPIFSEGDDAELLIVDARYARANGDYTKAVRLLEQALQLDPSHPIVRFELASTLMRRDRLTLLTLERVTAHLLGYESAGGASAAKRSSGSTCTFDASAATEPFDPRDVQDFDQIAGARPTLQYVIELLNDPDSPGEAPAMPPELTELDICEVIGPTGLNYDQEQVSQALVNQFESEEQVRGALTANAVALTLMSYVSLFEQPDLAVDWFIVDGDAVGACVADVDYELFLQRANAEVGRAGQALISLDMLLYHAVNGQFAGVVEDAVDFYNTLTSEEVNPCNDDL